MDEMEHQIFHWSLIVLNSLSFLFNFLIVIIIARHRKQFFPRSNGSRICRGINHNKFLFSLAVSDLLVGLFGVATGIMLKTRQEVIVYKLLGLIPLFGTMLVSVLSVILLTTDRLLAIKYPFKYDSIITDSRVFKVLSLTWIFTIIATISQIIIYLAVNGNFELKVRNVIFTAIFLTGFIVLSVSNTLLVMQVRIQNRRHAEPGADRYI